MLFQFFDPMHHCLTFPDYQLVPTLEEFSLLLGVPVLDQAPFTGLEGIPKPEVIAEALHLYIYYTIYHMSMVNKYYIEPHYII